MCFFVECDEITLSNLKPHIKTLLFKLLKFNIKDFTFIDSDEVYESQYNSHYIGAYIVLCIILLIVLLYISNALFIKDSIKETGKEKTLKAEIKKDNIIPSNTEAPLFVEHSKASIKDINKNYNVEKDFTHSNKK